MAWMVGHTINAKRLIASETSPFYWFHMFWALDFFWLFEDVAYDDISWIENMIREDVTTLGAFKVSTPLKGLKSQGRESMATGKGNWIIFRYIKWFEADGINESRTINLNRGCITRIWGAIVKIHFFTWCSRECLRLVDQD